METKEVMMLSVTEVVATSAVFAVCNGSGMYRGKEVEFKNFVNTSLERFLNGDWGEMDSEDDKKQNDDALEAWKKEDQDNYNRILAVYKTDLVEEGKIWIIEEWNRSVITILFPSDY